MARLAVTSLILVGLAVSLPTSSASASNNKPVLSDVGPSAFSLSWTTSKAVTGSVQVRVGKHWAAFQDVRGKVASTTHLFRIRCGTGQPCSGHLSPKTTYPVKVTGAGSKALTLTEHTIGVVSPLRSPASFGGAVKLQTGKPAAQALVYVTAHHAKLTSVPLATLTQPNGNWIVSLANTVTRDGNAFPLSKGDAVTVRAGNGRASGSASSKLSDPSGANFLSKPIVLK